MDYMNSDHDDHGNFNSRRRDESAFAALNRADLTHEPTSHATPGWSRVATLVALIVVLMSCLMLMVAR